MSAQDLDDAQDTINAIGDQLNRLGRAGWPELHSAIAGYVRERRGRIIANDSRVRPPAVADLLNLGPELEKLLTVLALGELAAVERAIYMRESDDRTIVDGDVVDEPQQLASPAEIDMLDLVERSTRYDTDK